MKGFSSHLLGESKSNLLELLLLTPDNRRHEAAERHFLDNMCHLPFLCSCMLWFNSYQGKLSFKGFKEPKLYDLQDLCHFGFLDYLYLDVVVNDGTNAYLSLMFVIGSAYDGWCFNYFMCLFWRMLY